MDQLQPAAVNHRWRRRIVPLAILAVLVIGGLLFLTLRTADPQIGEAGRVGAPPARTAPQAEVAAADPRAAMPEPATAGHLLASVRLSYGSGPGQVGLINILEQDIAGAESFAIGSGGTAFICDSVNQRLLVLDPFTGEILEIPLGPDAAPADLVVDDAGLILVYDYAGRIDAFSPLGESAGSVVVDPARWEVRTGLLQVGNLLLMQDVDQRVHLLAVVEDGTVRSPTAAELAALDRMPGIPGDSGTRYLAGLERWVQGWIGATLPDGSQQVAQVAAPGIASLSFLGEDATGNAYFQVERLGDPGVLLEVHRFSPELQPTGILPIPANDYFHWTIRLLAVDAEGRVHQALPLAEEWVFNVFDWSTDA